MKKVMKHGAWLWLTLLLAACGGSEQPTEQTKSKAVKYFIVDEMHSGLLRNFPGKVLANQQAELAFEVSGRIIKLPVNEGDELKQGTFIVAIDPEIYANKVSEAQARYDLAKANLARGEELVKNNFLSRAEYDILRAELAVEDANLRTAQRDLRNTEIYAPFDGIVARKFVENYEYVRAQQPIVQYNDTEHVDIEVYIPEYLVIVGPGEDDNNAQPVAVFESVPDQQFPLSFKEYSAQADPQTQAYRLVLTMPIPQGVNILPGMSATVRGVIPSIGNEVIEVPVTAVFADEQNQSYVWLIDKETMQIRKQPVKIGQMVGNNIFITDGLTTGDSIVATGVHFLQEGQTVHFIPLQDQ